MSDEPAHVERPQRRRTGELLAALVELADADAPSPDRVWRVDAETPYERDLEAQAFVGAHPDGAPLEAVAAAFGVSKSAIDQVEARLLPKLRRRLVKVL